MKYFCQFIMVSSVLLFTGSSSYSNEILMVKWMKGSDADIVFEKHLKKIRPDIKIRYIQSNRNKNLLVKALKGYDFSKVDLVYSFGTTTSKIVKAYLKGKKPQIFNFVSTPVLSRIADSIEKPGNNLTGAKLLVDLENQIDLITRVKDIKRLMVWFDPREKQNMTIRKRFLEITKKRNMELKLVRMIPDAKGFDKVLKKSSMEAQKYDALFMVSSASFYLMGKKMYSMLPEELLVMASLKNNVKFGATLSLTSDQIERSKTVAEMANLILDGKPAEDIPVNTVTGRKILLYVNKHKIDKVGLKDLRTLGLKIEQFPGDKVIYLGANTR